MFAEDDFAGRASEIFRLLRVFETSLAQRREAEIECAKALAALQALDAWRVAGCISAADLGERYAMPASEARNLLGCGKAMKAYPYLEQQMRKGKITVPSAGCLGEVFSTPALQKEDDDWLGWAQSESTQALKKRLEKRKEEVRLDAPPVPMNFFVSTTDRDDFQRARVIASRKAAVVLSDSQAFKVITGHYLDCFDDVRTEPGKRRLPDTAFVNGRYVPMSVRREIHLRQGERCAVPFCGNAIYLEFAHLVWHASGGSREADNLVLLCSRHHMSFDLGCFHLEGTAAKPRFLDRWGRDLTDRFAIDDDTPWFSHADLRDPPPGMTSAPRESPMSLRSRASPEPPETPGPPETPSSTDPPGPAPP